MLSLSQRTGNPIRAGGGSLFDSGAEQLAGGGIVGGIVAGNLIEQSQPGDAGIELQTATDVLVEDNTIILGDGVYPGAIEFRESSRIVVRNNQLTSTPWDRGNNSAISVYENTLVSP